MTPLNAELAAVYLLDDVPGAAIPGSRLYTILQRIDAGSALTVLQEYYLQERGYEALLELASGKMDREAFRTKSRKELERRLSEKIKAEQRELTERRRRDEATDRTNRALFAKKEKQLESRRFRDRLGQGYIEREHYGRVMRILRSVADGYPLDANDITWLGSIGSDYWTIELRRAHHFNQATALTEAWRKTGDAWQAINACSHWRKAGQAETGLSMAQQVLDEAVDGNLRSAALTTRGGALRDLNRHQEAIQSGEGAHAISPADFRPCTLLGAVHIEMGDHIAGAEWYERAEARGATKDSVDGELRSILAAASVKERNAIRTALKARDPQRYDWL